MTKKVSRREAIAMLGAGVVATAALALPGMADAAAIPTGSAIKFNLADYLIPGITVDAAFKKVNQDIKAAIDTSTVSRGAAAGRAILYIPAGIYVITDPTAFLASPDVRTLGLTIKGDGRGMTEIFFKPAGTGDKYLIQNNDKWLCITIQDITFQCGVDSFMLSTSNGGAQNYVFDRVAWGPMKYGIRLQGSNNNSEMTFNECGISGSVDTFLWSETSDQFVNYNFFACNFEVDKGCFCKFDKGGNINIWGGSFIHINGGGTFFKLLGNWHAGGVQRFICTGVRFEHRKLVSKLIECEWTSGTVCFKSCDMGSQAYNFDHKTVTAIFKSVNAPMPIIHFEDCTILGRHEYQYMVGSFAPSQLVSYNNCEFASAKNPKEQIVITNIDNSYNYGGTAPIRFTLCRGMDEMELWDSVYNFSVAKIGETIKRAVSLKGVDSKFPYKASPSTFLKLPLNAIITRVTLYMPAGAASSSAINDYKLQTGEKTPRVLAMQNKGTMAAGFKADSGEIFILCDTDAKRTLTLLAGSGINQAVGNGSMCIIEYIA
jgi:hypothetical protein